MASTSESLFLLEVLIDKIAYQKHPCTSERDYTTFVTITFLNAESFEISDNDVATDMPKGDPYVTYFNCGKSCLFPLRDEEVKQAMTKCTIKIVIRKSIETTCVPTELSMGECIIDMTKEFIQAIKMQKEEPSSISGQALQDSFIVTKADGTIMGDITLFLRLSCCGKDIVTQFQDGQDPLSYRGKDIVDRTCVPKREFKRPDSPCGCGISKSFKKITNTDSDNNVISAGYDDPCYCTGPRPAPKDELACRNIHQYCLHIPKGPSNDFEEIGTNLNGNELKIKVPKHASVIKKISQTHCSIQRPYAKGGKDNGDCQPPCGKNQINLALPCEPTCCAGTHLQGTQFTCTTEGCTMASKHGQTTTLAKSIPNTIAPNRDCFVLKVAKTAVDRDRKCKFELEVVTPKGPDKNPPIGKTSVRSQCDPECICWPLPCIRKHKKKNNASNK